MKRCFPRKTVPWLLGVLIAVSGPAALHAQQHRATRLGNPATRFAPPLTSEAELRRLFTHERYHADVEAILREAQWPGDVEDLRHAAMNAPVLEWPLPPGTRMPFMSARKDGNPRVLRDVLWAGKEPAPAYAFEFVSRGRRWRCVTPKPCSNFYLEDLGPAPRPGLRVELGVPTEVNRCEPFTVRVALINTGQAPLEQSRLTVTLGPGLRTEDDREELTLEPGSLAAKEGRQFRFPVRALDTGERTLVARALAGALRDEARASTRVRAPRLAVDCGAPLEVPLGRPVEVCLAVGNLGDAPETQVVLTLPVPEGTDVEGLTGDGRLADGVITWVLPELAPQEVEKCCVTFRTRRPGGLNFVATVRGACAPEAGTTCSTQVTGIPAVLLEVVDLADPVSVGDQVTYEIRVTNQGSAPLTRIRLACHLPEAQTFTAGAGQTPVTVASGTERTLLIEPLAVLEPGATASWQLTVRATAGGEQRVLVELTSDQFVRPITELESTTQY